MHIRRGLSIPEVLLLTAIIAIVGGVVIVGLLQKKQQKLKQSCIANLNIMDGAARSWALENKKSGTDFVGVTDVSQYLRGGRNPVCPGGGVYRGSTVSGDFTCTIPGHTL